MFMPHKLEKDEDVVFTGNEILQLTELAAMKEYQNNQSKEQDFERENDEDQLLPEFDFA